MNAESREGALGCKVNAESREGALGCKVNAESREGALGCKVNAVKAERVHWGTSLRFKYLILLKKPNTKPEILPELCGNMRTHSMY